MKMGKNLTAVVVSAALAMQGITVSPLWAAEAGTQSVYSAANNAEKRPPLPRMRRWEMRKEQGLQL